MPDLSPKAHLKAYRANAAQNQIIFGVSGSNSSVVSSVSVSSGGSYTSSPSVTLSGGGGDGAAATPVMGIGSVSITPQIISSPITTIVASSQTGSGAVFSPIYGGGDISSVGSVYINPSGSQTIGIQAPGSGATYQTAYGISKITVTPASPSGTYSSAATVSATGSGGFSGSATYSFKSLSASGGSDLFETAGSVPSLAATIGAGSGFSASSQFRPILFESVSGNVDLFWHTSDPAPTVSQVAGRTGTGSTFTLKFGIYQLQVDAAGSGYDDTVDILAGGTAIATIAFDISGGLDITTISFFYTEYGYFSATNLPTITISPRGNGTGGSVSISRCKLKKIDASGGSGYTATDISAFQTTGKLTTTNLKNGAGSPVNIDFSPFRLSVAQVYGVSLLSGGAGYSFSDSISWQNPSWVTLSSGVYESTDGPSLTTTKTVSGISITSAGSYTSLPAISVSNPSSGSAPSVTINSAVINSISNTSRGSGYSSSQSISVSGFFLDSDLSQAASSSNFIISGPWLSSISVTQPGSGYLVGDMVSFGQDSGTVATLKVVSMSIANGGLSYTSAPSVAFSGGGQITSASATATISLVTSSTSSFPSITISDANLTTGDARKIAQAIAECFFNIFNSGNAGTRVSAKRTYSAVASDLGRTVTYAFSFLAYKSGGYLIKNEP